MMALRSGFSRLGGLGSAGWMLAMLAGAMLGNQAQAGPVFFAGELREGKFVREGGDKPAEGKKPAVTTPDAKPADAKPTDANRAVAKPAGAKVAAKEAAEGSAEVHCFYTVRYSSITATADDRSARVQVVESIEGPDKGVKTVCLIPLPASASPDGLTVSVAETGGETAAIKTAKFLTAAEAQKVYETISRGSDSVAVLALTGQPAVLIPHYELKGKRTFTIDFRQAVREEQGVLSIQCPMPATQWTHAPVSRVTLTASVTATDSLRAMFSPTHGATIERTGLQKATARVKAADWTGDDDFRLCWVADKDDLGLRVLTYREEGEEDGYFMLLGNPTGSDKKPVDKDVLLVLDTSGSMRGEKMEQARAAIDYCVAHLQAGDRFNVVTFGTDVTSFRDDPVAADKETIGQAREFVEKIVARGQTNISGALEKALAGKATPGRPRIMIFLTDGAPTVGEREPEKILGRVKQANASGTKIFVMGLGHDVNAHLLDKLADLTDGSSEYVAPEEEIDAKVATLYDRLSHPVLTNVALSFGGLQTHSVYPKKLPALFKGSEVMIFGRYQGGGEHTVKISGQLHGKPVEYSCSIDAPKKPAGQATNFVAPLWASRNVGFLLQELRLHGPNDELIKEVVRLSKKFGIVTEYTVFLSAVGGRGFRGGFAGEMPAFAGVPAGGAAFDRAALADAKGRIEQANVQQAGKWAVNQAMNDKQLQSRTVATREGNTYVDRQGRRVAADENIRQIGARTYYLGDGQWVDAQEAGKRQTRVVKLYSDEYYQLLRGNADFARAQQLGWAVELNIGNERVVVEKDGQRKDEKLRVKEPPPGPAQNFRGGPNSGLQQQQLPRDLRNQFNAPNEQQNRVPRNRE